MDKILEKFNKLFDDIQRPIEHWHLIHPEKADTVFHVALQGEALLNNPKWNKGLGFTAEERKAFNLNGRLPSGVQTLDKQCKRAYLQVSAFMPPAYTSIDPSLVHLSLLAESLQFSRTHSCKVSNSRTGFYTTPF